MTTFNTLKKSGNEIDRLNKEIEKLKAPVFEKTEDDTIWKPEVDKSGNGTADIRFLPNSPVDGDDGLPWVRIFSHSFKGPTGKWYIENSLTTPTEKFPKGQKDPLSEYNTYLWNLVDDDNSPTRKQARLQKRKLSYWSNIYVISDPKRPDREGKVFKFKYGKKIFDKILLSMNPEFEGDPQVNPFDLWKGADFRLRIRTVDGYPNYDQSVFKSPSTLGDFSDEELEKIWKSEYSLKSLLSEDKFKTYDQLKAHLEVVMGRSYDELMGGGTSSTVKAAPVDIRKRAEEIKTMLDDDGDTDDELAKFKALAD